MEPIKPSGVNETLDKHRKAKRAAYFLLLYLIVATVAAVWFGVSSFKQGQEIEKLFEQIEGMVGQEVEAATLAPAARTIASWYDYELNGIPWSKDHRTAASREFERGTLVEVTNIENGKSVVVLINDYGPDESVHPDRALDLSSFAFSEIADLASGTVTVEYRAIGKGEYRPIW